MEIGFGSCFTTRSCQLLVKLIVSLDEEEEIVTVFCKSASDCCTILYFDISVRRSPNYEKSGRFPARRVLQIICYKYHGKTQRFLLDGFFVKFPKSITIFSKTHSKLIKFKTVQIKKEKKNVSLAIYLMYHNLQISLNHF